MADSTFLGKTEQENLDNIVLYACFYVAATGSDLRWRTASEELVACALLPCQSELFKQYCTAPAPDVCCCGKIFSSRGFRLRTDCRVCEGEDNFLGYAGAGVNLRLRFGINESWTCWAFTWAVYYRNKAKESREIEL